MLKQMSKTTWQSYLNLFIQIFDGVAIIYEMINE